MSETYYQRPDHPDFWRLSEAVIGSDDEADNGHSIREIVGRYADPDSVFYVAEQRAMRIMPPGVTEDDDDDSLLAMFVAVWMDAFVAGARYTRITTLRDGQTRIES